MQQRIYNTSSDFVYLDLRGRIVSRELKPAQRLLEMKIAAAMGVSRTPVREALRRLASEGLVKIVPNSGARVASPTAGEMENAYRVREYLEDLSVELACRSAIDQRTLGKLDDSLRAAESALEKGDRDAFLEANSAFHRLIAEAGKNYVLCDYIENLMLRTNVYIFFSDSFKEEEDYSLKEHRSILRAIEERDLDKAQERMREHLRRSYRALSAASAAAQN
ncbi:MAG: GntR family transcriptional regulator [Synergistaceae bacterium]|nr:GntR family transcriptional regulator [Synergistaceae bacterium]